jgi:2-polyprenyl-6-methoxyphenol hydroxylase-like FAD-dependent oxidoreductase
MIEAALARVADATPGLTVRRGVAVDGLLTGAEAIAGVPNVVGVRTETGEDISADLVVDASGRRSPMPRWIDAIGARPAIEELEDSGFVYYGRHFRSSDGSLPAMIGPLLGHYGSVSILTLPADNGTWGVGFTACASDAEVRGLKDNDRWTAAMQQFPLVAHWTDADPIDDVAVMAKIEDRFRRYVVDGDPVVTGVVAVGDAWSCTNPSLGRGATIGLMHAVALRDTLRKVAADDAAAFARAFDDVTVAELEPWYRGTLLYDRHRLAEAGALARGETYEPGDPVWEITRALQSAAGQDDQLMRAFMRLAGLLAGADDVLAAPGVLDKVISLGSGWRDEPILGPTRDELVKLANG